MVEKSRALDTATLDAAARFWAGQFLQPDVFSVRNPKVAVAGREWVMQSFFNATFKDEFDYLLEAFTSHLGPATLAEFEALKAERFKPRSAEVLKKVLADKLAITPAGDHIDGKIGTVQLGNRRVGLRLIAVESSDSIQRRKRLGIDKSEPGAREMTQKLAAHYWPIYAGEGEERAADSGVADALPDGTEPLPIGALNTRISNEVALLMCDACVDNLDEGSLGAVIQGRTGAQPADPDTAVTGTNLFTLTCSATAFGAASDAAPGGIATANAITDDSSADATGTLGYCRGSSSSVADTPLDDHIDGEAGVSGADFNFNTLAIVSGAVVSMTSWTVTMPEA